MITYVKSELFTSPALVLVNTVNTVGVMGKGIAKEFKSIYPEMFSVYQKACEREDLTIGKLLLYKTPHKWVLNFPTKRHWRMPSRLEDIESGLRTFAAQFADESITSVSFPQLGCGNGGLNWELEVRPVMERYLGVLPIDVYIHISDRPGSAPEHSDRALMKAWLRGEPRSLAFTEFRDDLFEVVASMPLAETFSGNWRVARVNHSGASALRFSLDGSTVDMPEEDLLDLWQHFRSFGFISASDFPKPYHRVSQVFLDVVARLRYVEKTQFTALTRVNGPSETTADLLASNDAHGIRLVPPVATNLGVDQASFIGELSVA